MAFVELGLTEQQFFSMPPYRTFMMQMYNQRRIDRQWEQTRYVASMVHNMAGKVSKTDISPKKLMRLSFDEAEKYPEWTQEDAQDLIDKWPDIKKN